MAKKFHEFFDQHTNAKVLVDLSKVETLDKPYVSWADKIIKLGDADFARAEKLCAAIDAEIEQELLSKIQELSDYHRQRSRDEA